MPIPVPVTNLGQDTTGYGQLSISTSQLTPTLVKHAAGVWALEGPEAEVNSLKPAGPTATAAVVAYSDNQAVWAESKSGPAITGTSQSSQGVTGNSQSSQGVSGNSDSSQGVYGKSNSNIGVVGESTTNNGVYGVSHAAGAAAVAGRNLSTDANKVAGYFDGNVIVTGTVNAYDLTCPGADCAEVFAVDRQAVEPGTVMVMGDEEQLSPCSGSYDSRVAGVVSGGERYRPGLVLNSQESAENRRAIALIGRVYCKADASYGCIEVGDLLTTSPTTGHAMKAQDPSKSFGATLGKALRPLREGRGLIPVLVALQ